MKEYARNTSTNRLTASEVAQRLSRTTLGSTPGNRSVRSSPQTSLTKLWIYGCWAARFCDWIIDRSGILGARRGPILNWRPNAAYESNACYRRKKTKTNPNPANLDNVSRPGEALRALPSDRKRQTPRTLRRRVICPSARALFSGRLLIGQEDFNDWKKGMEMRTSYVWFGAIADSRWTFGAEFQELLYQAELRQAKAVNTPRSIAAQCEVLQSSEVAPVLIWEVKRASHAWGRSAHGLLRTIWLECREPSKIPANCNLGSADRSSHDSARCRGGRHEQ